MVTFRARFTGICAYIPDVEFEDPKEDPKKVTIIFIDARLPNDGKGTLALDGTPIRPHAPIIQFDPSNLVGSGMSQGIRLNWFFERKRISFKIEEANPARESSNDFTVVQRLKGGSLSSPEVKRDFNWGMHIRGIAEDSQQLGIDERFLDDAKSKGSVVAKVVLEKYGEVSSYNLDAGTIFRIATQLNGQFDCGPLSEQVALEFRDTHRVTLIAEDLDDDSVDPVEFVFDTSEVAEGGNPVDVLIGNFCCDNIMPRYNDESVQVQGSDEDFRWYYELFDSESRKRLLSNLAGLSLPVPFPVESSGGGTGLKPVQCMRLSLHAYKY